MLMGSLFYDSLSTHPCLLFLNSDFMVLKHHDQAHWQGPEGCVRPGYLGQRNLRGPHLPWKLERTKRSEAVMWACLSSLFGSNTT